jgi:uncharacterized protein YegP (UPF0339 family)
VGPANNGPLPVLPTIRRSTSSLAGRQQRVPRQVAAAAQDVAPLIRRGRAMRAAASARATAVLVRSAPPSAARVRDDGDAASRSNRPISRLQVRRLRSTQRAERLKLFVGGASVDESMSAARRVALHASSGRRPRLVASTRRAAEGDHGEVRGVQGRQGRVPETRLKANNGHVIATGESYKTEAGVLNGIASIKRNAPDATIVDVAD